MRPRVSRTRGSHAPTACTICYIYIKESWNKNVVSLKRCVMERRKAFKFNTPTSVMIAGPSGCGKTVCLLLDSY